MNLLVGTKNAYKVSEMEYLLKNIPDVKIFLLRDSGINIDVDENQSSLKGNAEKKAIEISKNTNMYVLTSDGGLDIPSLGSKWNMLTSQRNVGHDKTDLEKVNILLSLMKDLHGDERKITNSLALALAYKGELLWSDEQITERGFVAESLIDEEIPTYRWIGHLWYYSQFKKVFNKLDENELSEVRKQSDGLKKSLKKGIENLLKGM